MSYYGEWKDLTEDRKPKARGACRGPEPLYVAVLFLISACIFMAGFLTRMLTEHY